MTRKIDGTFTGRRVFAVRVATPTPDKLAELALEMGFFHVGRDGQRLGSAGQLMDAIASGQTKLESKTS